MNKFQIRWGDEMGGPGMYPSPGPMKSPGTYAIT